MPASAGRGGSGASAGCVPSPLRGSTGLQGRSNHRVSVPRTPTGDKDQPVLTSKSLHQLREVVGDEAPLVDELEVMIAAHRQHTGLFPLLKHHLQAVVRTGGQIGQNRGKAYPDTMVVGKSRLGSNFLK